jgi:hypothetical protein
LEQLWCLLVLICPVVAVVDDYRKMIERKIKKKKKKKREREREREFFQE